MREACRFRDRRGKRAHGRRIPWEVNELHTGQAHSPGAPPALRATRTGAKCPTGGAGCYASLSVAYSWSFR